MDRWQGSRGGGDLQASEEGLRVTPWQLPRQVSFGGKNYRFSSDYRDILEIFSYWEDPRLPEFAKWQIALALFYEKPIPPALQQQAMSYLAWFVEGGRSRGGGRKLLDWQQDADLIVSDVNKVAGCEIRALRYVHWWTFLAWFHGIGEGRLSTVVAIRDKLATGKKLDSWQAAFFSEHKNMVKPEKRLSREEMLQQAHLQCLLEGRNVSNERGKTHAHAAQELCESPRAGEKIHHAAATAAAGC